MRHNFFDYYTDFFDFINNENVFKALHKMENLDSEIEKKQNIETESTVEVVIDGKSFIGSSVKECIDKWAETMKKLIEKKPYVFTDVNGKKFAIKKVKFSNPATIIFWDDNTKTVVKTHHEDTFDKEKGMAMAILKKICGNNREYFDMFREYCNESKE